MSEQNVKHEYRNIRVTEKMKEALRDFAKDEKRTLSAYVTILLEEHVERRLKHG